MLDWLGARVKKERKNKFSQGLDVCYLVPHRVRAHLSTCFIYTRSIPSFFFRFVFAYCCYYCRYLSTRFADLIEAMLFCVYLCLSLIEVDVFEMADHVSIEVNLFLFIFSKESWSSLNSIGIVFCDLKKNL